MSNKVHIPPLSNGRINIFLIRDLDTLDQKLLDSYLDCLLTDDKSRHSRFRFEKDRRLFLLAHCLQQTVLANYLDCHPNEVTYKTNDFGKPFLSGDSEITFNLSHSHGVAAFAVTNDRETELGIDTEPVRVQNDVLDLARNYFSESEFQIMKESEEDNRPYSFFRIWTLKEAYIKAVGKGLAIDLNSFAFDFEGSGIGIDHKGNPIESGRKWRFFQTEVYDQHLLALGIRSNRTGRFDIRVFEFYPHRSCKEVPTGIVYSS